MRKAVSIALFLIFFGTSLFAEERDTVLNNVESNLNSEINLNPQFRGTLRVRGEHDFNENVNRFSVVNARAVVFGNANEWLSYQMQVDLNNHGQFRLLDMEARFRENRDLSFRVGQMLVPFGQIQQLVPRMVVFTELPWIVRYMSGSFRDIGVNATYRFRINDFPASFTGGIYNGAGINNPVWSNSFAHSFRLMFGGMSGFRFSLKTYHAENLALEIPTKHEIYGIDFRFFNNGLTIDAEIIRGNYIRAGETMRKVGSFLHVGQLFHTGKNTLKYLEPIVRWDMMGMANNFDFSDANRLTFGLNFGFREFNQNQFFRTAELRLNYAMNFVNENRASLYFGDNRALWANKLILEFLLEI
ncbi:MAG: OprO/OprP family phosphate-selective porin [Bacteroidales bacterium]|nr:OprO/OprP family phosphate-selective porin [Bacteroidales bacterium]